MRISRPQLFMEIAHVVAKRATCMRLSVGAVLVHQRSIVAIGYNGVAAGDPHCGGNDCPGRYECKLTTHAEVNALKHLPPNTNGALDLYVTDSPCADCYEEIINDARVTRIFFGTPYRINEHLMPPHGHGRDFFTRPMPEVYRVTPSGYIMNWRTKLLEDVRT